MTALRCCVGITPGCCKSCPAAPENGREDAIKTYAADLIANQQRHIEALMQANRALRQRWVPVTERLPADDGHYLCRYEFYGAKMAFYQTLDYYATDVQPHFQHEGMHGLRVTHWMPLPEAPEEVEEAENG